MVDLNRAVDGGQRAQVLLVTTFGIAVLFVLLTLVLNASAFTQTMATQHGDDGRDAVGFSVAAVDGVEGALEYINRHNDTSYSDLQTELEDSVDGWNAGANSYAARHGGRTTISLTGTTDGARIVQANEARALTSATNANDWTLASGVSATRYARLNVSQTSLVNDPSTVNSSVLRNESVFRVVVDGSQTWELFLYSDGSGNVVARVDDTSGTLQSECVVTPDSNGYAVVDLAKGTVEGTACDKLDAFENAGSTYSVAYRNASNAAGTYELLVDEPAGGSDYALEGSGKPYVEPRLYSASFRVTYVTARAEYVTDETVVAGEIDG